MKPIKQKQIENLVIDLGGKQPLNSNLTAISSLVGSGLLRITNNVWTLDTNNYLTSANLIGFATETWVNNNFINKTHVVNGISQSIIDNWNLAFNSKINSATVTGTTTKTLTLTKEDGTTIIASWADTNTTYAVIPILELNTGTASTGRLVSATILTQWGNGKYLQLTDPKITNWDLAFSWGNHQGLYSLLGHTHSSNEIVNLTGLGNGSNVQLTTSMTLNEGLANLQFQINTKTSNLGTVTSVGLTVAGNALNTNLATITTTGIFGLTWGGTALQYVNGQGNLVTMPVYNVDTLAILNTGTSTTGALQTSKNLNDWLNSKNYVTSAIITGLASETWVTTNFINKTHVVNAITATNIINWNNAFGWGDHALQGYLKLSTLPNPSLITSTSATGITNVTTTNANTFMNIVFNGGSIGSSSQITGSGSVTVASDVNGKITITGINTTYSVDTLAILNTGTSTTGALQTSKNLNDWLNGKGFITSTALNGYALESWVTTNYLQLTDSRITNWTDAFNSKINSAVVTGTTTKIMTFTRQDGSTFTATWADSNTTYTIDTLSILNTGTSTTGALQTSKNLNDWLNGKGFITSTALNGYALESWVTANFINKTHVVNAITSGDIVNWNNAFGWGDHALQGYLKTTDLNSLINNVTQNYLKGRIYSRNNGSEINFASIPIIDIRSTVSGFGTPDGTATYLPLGNDPLLNNTMTPIFHYRPGTSIYTSSIVMKGWTGNYGAWMISGNAHASNSSANQWFLTSSNSTTGVWNTPIEIIHADNLLSFIPAHTGDVTGTTILTIATSAVTLPKIQNISTATFLGRVTAGTGNVEMLTVAQMQTALGFSTQTLTNSTSNLIVSNTVQRAALTGDVTAPQNSNTLTIATSAVTLPKIQNILTATFLGRVTTGTGNVEMLTAAQMQTALGYLTSFTETDPTVPSHVKSITTGDITNWNNKFTLPTGGTINHYLNGTGTWSLIPTAQNLSLGTSAGQINISGGGTGVTLTSIGANNRPDANVNPYAGGGLQAFVNSGSAINYPSDFGGGVSYTRNPGTFAGAFDIWASNINDNKLYYRRGSETTTYNSYEIFASESWVTQQITNAGGNYITTNTTQTGLTGNKTTSGIITSSGGFVGTLTGNATTATTLATARTINGTSFNGSVNIVTALWGTARNITIGNTTKSVNGSANIAWSLTEIGAASLTSLSDYYTKTETNDNFHKLAKTNVEAINQNYYGLLQSLEANNVLGNTSYFLSTGSTIGGILRENSHLISFGVNSGNGFQLIKDRFTNQLNIRTRQNSLWLSEETFAYQSWVTQQIGNLGIGNFITTNTEQIVAAKKQWTTPQSYLRENNIRHIHNVANSVGTIASLGADNYFLVNFGSSLIPVMWEAEIEIYEYSSVVGINANKARVKRFLITGYDLNATSLLYNRSVVQTDGSSNEIESVTFFRDANGSIILGFKSVSTWSYPKVYLKRLSLHHNQTDAIENAVVANASVTYTNNISALTAYYVAPNAEILKQSGDYLEKSSLSLSPTTAWDTLKENRLVQSTSAANSPFTQYGIGINLYGNDSTRGQLFFNTNTGYVQYRTANSTGWSTVKTVWDDSNFNPSNYALITNVITSNTNQTGLTGNKETSGQWTISGIQIGTTAVSGTFLGFNSAKPFSFLNSGNAQLVLSGGLLASNNYADNSLIPTNGIYSKGSIATLLHGNSSQWNHEIYGLGISTGVIANDWDILDKTGMYYNSNTAPVGAPVNVSMLTVFHQQISSTQATQMAMRSGADNYWFRRKAAGIWQPWVEIIHTGNAASLIGTNYWNTTGNQTGLSGNKTTSGALIFDGTQATSLFVYRTANTGNSSMAYGFDGVANIYTGAGDANTFAIASTPALSAPANQWFFATATGIGTRSLVGSYLYGRDNGGFSVDVTQTSASWSTLVRHRFSNANHTFGLGGIQNAGNMQMWGMTRYLNDTTTNSAPNFFGWFGSSDQLRASSLEGTGDRVMYANSMGLILNRPVSDFALSTDYLKLDGTSSMTGVIELNRVSSQNTGISWYSSTYKAWRNYMSPAGTGPAGIVAPTGELVTSWGLRSFIEQSAGYGWTFEKGTAQGTTPTVVAEIRSSDGAARFGSVSVYGGTAQGFLKANGTIDTNVYALASAIPTINDYVTTNTTQTGLIGNKVTSGIWDYTNPNGLYVSGTFGRVRLGRQSSDGDVSVGSSGTGSPPTGTTQDYGFYLAYNAYRDSDGYWKHSRQTSVIANIFKGGHHTDGFSWGYSPNVGASNVDFTELMKLSNNGELKINSTSANVLKIERTNNTNTNIEYINSGISIFAGSTNGTSWAVGGTADLNTISARWMWVDNTGLVSAKAGFSKTGATDADILLGSGGHRPVTDFALASSMSNYVSKTGDTMSGALNFSTTTAIQYLGVSKVTVDSVSTVIASGSTGAWNSGGIHLRPVASNSTVGQLRLGGVGNLEFPTDNTGYIARTSGNSRTFNKVYQNYIQGVSTGILSIKFPQVSTSSTMFDVTIKFYSYQLAALAELRVSFYRQASNNIHATAGMRALLTKTSTFPTEIVSVGIDANGMVSVNIGETATAWSSYLSFEVERVETKFTGYNNDWGTGWTSAFETSTAGYIMLHNVPVEVLRSGNNNYVSLDSSIPNGVIGSLADYNTIIKSNAISYVSSSTVNRPSSQAGFTWSGYNTSGDHGFKIHGGINGEDNLFYSRILAGVNGSNFQVASREWANGTFALASSLGSYLPLAGGTMTGTINSTNSNILSWNGDVRLHLNANNTLIGGSNNTLGSIYFRPQGTTSTTNQVIINNAGTIVTSGHGDSSQWKQAFDWGRGLRVEGNGVAVHNIISTDTNLIRNAVLYANGAANRPNASNASVVNFTPYSTGGATYGFSIGKNAGTDRIWFRSEDNSVFGNWIEFIHSGNISSFLPSIPTASDFITTNTTQTGLSGNKTTSGLWDFQGVKIGAILTSYLGVNLAQDFAIINGTAANRILTGGVLASNAYADASKIPTNGIFSKGVISTESYYISSRLGYFGTYNSTQTQGIWSMGTGFQASASTTTLGTQYGLAYSYIDVGGSSWASKHQIHFATNGTATTTINLTDGIVRSNQFQTLGGLSTQFLKADGTKDSTSYLPFQVLRISLDLDLHRTSGIVAGGSGSTTNIPAGAYSYSPFLTMQSASDRWVQMWFDSYGPDKKIRYRGGTATTWDSWQIMATEEWADGKFALAGSLADYLPLAGGTMNSGAVLNWAGTQASLQLGSVNKLRYSNIATILSANSIAVGTGQGIFIRPQGDTLNAGQVHIDYSGQINSSNHGNSSLWQHRIYNANGADQYLGGNYVSGGLEKPNYFGGGKLKLQMLRGTNIGATTNGAANGGWFDALWLSSYEGGDVPGSNILVFGKQGDTIGFIRQNFDSLNWGTYREILHSGNINSFLPSLAGFVPYTGAVNHVDVGAYRLSGGSLGVNNSSNTTGLGLSLYGGATPGMPSYGIAFSGTPVFGTHGSVTDSWATYFTMSGATTRGWIFKHGTDNVASISSAGIATFNSLIGVGNRMVITNANGTLSSQDIPTYLGSTSIILASNSFQRAALTGDVTAPQNSNATTIAVSAVTLPKIQNISTSTFLGRITAGTGNVEMLTVAQMQTALGIVSYTASTSILFSGSSIIRAALTGDVTAPQNSNATTIAVSAVTLPKIQNISTMTFLGRVSSGTGNVEMLTVAQMQTALGITGGGGAYVSKTGDNMSGPLFFDGQTVSPAPYKTGIYASISSHAGGGSNPVTTLMTGSVNHIGIELVGSYYKKLVFGGSDGNITFPDGSYTIASQQFTKEFITEWSIMRDNSGGYNNASGTGGAFGMPNKFWFDYDWAGTGQTGSVVSFSGLDGGYSTELFGNYWGGNYFGIRTRNGDTGQWNPVRELWHNGNLNFGAGLNYNPATGNLSIIGNGSTGIGVGNPATTFSYGDISFSNGGGLIFSHSIASKTISITNGMSVGTGIGMTNYQLYQTISTSGSGNTVSSISQTTNGFQVNLANRVTAVALNVANTEGLINTGTTTVTTSGTFMLGFTSGYSLVKPADRTLLSRLERLGKIANYTSSSTSILNTSAMDGQVEYKRIYNSGMPCAGVTVRTDNPVVGDKIVIQGIQCDIAIRGIFGNYTIRSTRGSTTTYNHIQSCISNGVCIFELVYCDDGTWLMTTAECWGQF